MVNKDYQFLQAFHQQLTCFNDEYQVSIAHSVFKQSDHNVIAHQLEKKTRSKSVAKNDTIALLINS